MFSFLKKRTKYINVLDSEKIPKHIAVVMDGNGRWANKRGLPRVFGHREGANNLKKVCMACAKIGIKHFTVYAFSTENWQRPKSEVDTLMNLLLEYLKKADNELGKENIRIMVIGDKNRLSFEINKEIERVERITSNNDGLYLYIALNYGGRNEIVSATKNVAKDVLDKKLSLDDICEESFKKYIYTNNVPDPELLIRSGGEKRISNFLLWQIAYTELWFTEVLWPDFNEKVLYEAIIDYQNRSRRFGGV